MFESLSERLGGVFDRLRGRGALNENDVREAMREVRVALSKPTLPFPLSAALLIRSPNRPLANRSSVPSRRASRS